MRERALDAAVGIIRALSPEQTPREPSLASGDAGLALVHDYVGRALSEKKHVTLAKRYLERAARGAGLGALTLAFGSGLTGVAWAFQQLGAAQAVAGVDALVAQAARAATAAGPFDYLDGWAGIVAYAATRPTRSAAGSALDALLQHLGKALNLEAPSEAWKTPRTALAPEVAKAFPRGVRFLGVAHGAAGVLGALLRTGEAGRALSEQAAAQVLAKARRTGLPATVPAGKYPLCRFGWCHGAPGASVVLLRAGNVHERPEWSEVALTLARGAAKLKAEQVHVPDVGLCHGAAGLAHLFLRLHHATGEDVFADASRRWWLRTLNGLKHRNGIAGFAAWTPGSRWEARTGLLEGAAGVAAALVAACTAHPPAWDEALLLSGAAS